MLITENSIVKWIHYIEVTSVTRRLLVSLEDSIFRNEILRFFQFQKKIFKFYGHDLFFFIPLKPKPSLFREKKRLNIWSAVSKFCERMCKWFLRTTFLISSITFASGYGGLVLEGLNSGENKQLYELQQSNKDFWSVDVAPGLRCPHTQKKLSMNIQTFFIRKSMENGKHTSKVWLLILVQCNTLRYDYS